jgi:uncharacterized membrane protein
MFSFYLLLKYIHILSAIVAVGANLTYAVWNIRGAREPAHEAFALKGIQFLDNRVANPAYGVLFLTGLLMLFSGQAPGGSWAIAAIVLFIVLVAVAVAFYTPALRGQVKLADTGDTSSAAFMRLGERARAFGIATGLLVLVILVLMVFKPAL